MKHCLIPPLCFCILLFSSCQNQYRRPAPSPNAPQGTKSSSVGITRSNSYQVAKSEYDANFQSRYGLIYSGTVAAAIEGRFVGFPSIAISLASWDGKNFDTAAKVAEIIADNVEFSELSPNTVLNVNVPDIPFNEIKGFKTTRLGKRHQSENIIQDKKDTSLYWIGENGKEDENGPGTDFYAIRNNYVSITPLQIDLTNNNEIEKVDNWIKKII